MKVYIVGAGPGDPELLTLRGAKLIEQCPIVFYTGSLVPREVIARARADAKVIDSSSMDLDQIVEVLKEAHRNDQDVARVHTGDPSIFGSTAEQIRKMEELGIPYEIVPGVSSFTAAAAVLGKELTLPELSQTVIITRAEGRTPMPEKEKLASLAEHRATLVLFLSITLMRKVVEDLIPYYGRDCPVGVVQKATWPDQKIVLGTLENIVERVRKEKITSQAVIIVGRILTSKNFADSRLYDPTFTHSFRKARPNPAGAKGQRADVGGQARQPLNVAPTQSTDLGGQARQPLNVAPTQSTDLGGQARKKGGVGVDSRF